MSLGLTWPAVLHFLPLPHYAKEETAHSTATTVTQEKQSHKIKPLLVQGKADAVSLTPTLVWVKRLVN